VSSLSPALHIFPKKKIPSARRRETASREPTIRDVSMSTRRKSNEENDARFSSAFAFDGRNEGREGYIGIIQNIPNVSSFLKHACIISLCVCVMRCFLCKPFSKHPDKKRYVDT